MARSGNSEFEARYLAVSVVAASSCATFWGSVEGRDSGEAFVAHRGHGEAADHLDNPIEFESLQGSRLHDGCKPLMLAYIGDPVGTGRTVPSRHK